MSAPPQAASLSPPKAPSFPEDLQHSPPQSKFEPELPPAISRPLRISTPPKRVGFSPIDHRSRPSPSSHFTNKDHTPGLDLDDEMGAHGDQAESQSDGVENPDSLEVTASSRMTGDEQLIRRRPAPPLQRSRSRLMTVIYLIAILATSYLVKQYKDESSAIGYCDTGSSTNQALQDLEARRAAAEASNRDNRTVLYPPSIISDIGLFEDGIPVPALSFLAALHPSTCAPCPEFASCTQYSVMCNPGYVPRPHPLLGVLSPFGSETPVVDSLWSLIGDLTNGLPGLGPIAFPPRCVEDPKRKRNIGALGKAVEALLGQERGRLLCSGESSGRGIVSDSEGGEAKKWGLEVERLREVMKRKTAVSSFEDLVEMIGSHRTDSRIFWPLLMTRSMKLFNN